MTGRIFEAGHTTAPDHMPERAQIPLASVGASTHAPCARGIFGAARDAVSGADMCPASAAASHMLRALVVFAGRVQIEAACSKALCCTRGLPVPSHDRCAMPLLALFRSDALATALAYAAAAGAR